MWLEAGLAILGFAAVVIAVLGGRKKPENEKTYPPVGMWGWATIVAGFLICAFTVVNARWASLASSASEMALQRIENELSTANQRVRELEEKLVDAEKHRESLQQHTVSTTVAAIERSSIVPRAVIRGEPLQRDVIFRSADRWTQFPGDGMSFKYSSGPVVPSWMANGWNKYQFVDADNVDEPFVVRPGDVLEVRILAKPGQNEPGKLLFEQYLNKYGLGDAATAPVAVIEVGGKPHFIRHLKQQITISTNDTDPSVAYQLHLFIVGDPVQWQVVAERVSSASD